MENDIIYLAFMALLLVIAIPFSAIISKIKFEKGIEKLLKEIEEDKKLLKEIKEDKKEEQETQD